MVKGFESAKETEIERWMKKWPEHRKVWVKWNKWKHWNERQIDSVMIDG